MLTNRCVWQELIPGAAPTLNVHIATYAQLVKICHHQRRRSLNEQGEMDHAEEKNAKTLN
jgi:hypothetical protein